MQGITHNQLTELTSTCLQRYKLSGIPKTRSESTLLNPILYRDDLAMIEDGVTIEDSDFPCTSPMSWTWLSLQSSAGSERPRLVKKSLSANLFALLSGRTIIRQVRSRPSRKHYAKKVRFVNVGLNLADEKTIEGCMNLVRYQINDRRRYHTILAGEFGPNEEIAVLDYPTRRRHKIFKYCAPEQWDRVSNKLCISNRGRRDTFQYKLTSVIQTNLSNNPTLVAFSV